MSADTRPTNASRITSIRIISRSSFLLLAKARAYSGLSRLKLECFAQEPALPPITERLFDYCTLQAAVHRAAISATPRRIFSCCRSRAPGCCGDRGPGGGQGAKTTHSGSFA